MGKIIRGMSLDRHIRYIAVDATDIVETARKLHHTAPTATAALGRTLAGGVMLGKLLKGDHDIVTLQIRGKGIIKSIVAVSTSYGQVKGYISDPDVDLSTSKTGGLHVGQALGTDGELIVIKDFGMKEPFVGRVDLATGEIAEDLATYFMYSEQQPSIVSLGVELNETGEVIHAGGMIIQPMPYAPEETIDALEKAAQNMLPFTKLREMNSDLEVIVKNALPNFEVEMLDEDEAFFKCDCSYEKTEKALVSIGKTELEKMIDEDGQAELNCHFCNKSYNFDRQALEKLLFDAQS